MIKANYLYESNYWFSEGENTYDSERDFLDNHLNDFIGCNHLYLNGVEKESTAIWNIRYNNEIIYFNPDGVDHDYNYIEEVLEKFYFDDKPQNRGFVERQEKEVSKGATVLKIRGGETNIREFWEYIE